MAPRKAPIVACQRGVRGGWDEIEGWFTGMVDHQLVPHAPTHHARASGRALRTDWRTGHRIDSDHWRRQGPLWALTRVLS